MKFSICVCLIVLLSYESVSGWVSTGVSRNPDHPGKCVVAGEVLEPGTYHRTPKSCCRVVCSEGGFYDVACCGVVGTQAPCWIDDTDNGADYPDCCPRAVCPDDTRY